jgi:serine/threonine protein kinase
MTTDDNTCCINFFSMQDEALKGRVAEHIKALEAEVAVLRTLRHRNIVRYLGTERTEDAFNIFLEYVPGGSIASLIDKFGPLQVHIYMPTPDTLQAYMHTH